MNQAFRHLAGGLAATACCLTLTAHAASGSISIVAPYTPGGIVDSTTRILAEQMQKQLGQNVIVENVPGAGGQIGTGKVVRSDPDGRTLLMSGNGVAYRHLLFKVPYDPVRQLQPISLIVTSPSVWVVHPSVPVHNIAELIEYTKKHGFSVGNSGKGGPTHLQAEQFGLAAKVDLTYVPYRGDSAAIADVVAGNINSSVSSLSATRAFIEAGRLRAIAIFESERLKSLPNVQSIAEAGFPHLATGNSFVALLAPAGVPKQTIDRLIEAASASCHNAETRQKLEATGSTVVCSGPQELTKVMQSTAESVQTLVDSGRLKLEQ